MASPRPWWRHWHVEGHGPGYKLFEAKQLAAEESKFWGRDIRPERCDTDHSLIAVIPLIRADSFRP